MHTRKNKKISRKGNRRGRKGGATSTPNLLTYRGPNILPSRLRTTLRFDATSFINNAGVAHAGIRFEPTYAYDIDPVLGSTAMPGFSELAGIYRFYRVFNVRARVQFANKETFPVMVFICPTNFDFGANPATYQNMISNRASRTRYLGATSGNAVGSLSTSFSPQQFGGSSSTLASDPYTARADGTAGAPVNNIWFNIGTLADSVHLSGVSYNLVLNVTLDFFEFANPAT